MHSLITQKEDTHILKQICILCSCRKKKTVAESRRLEYIQKELAKIESLLCNDVNILRDRIETTSRDFLEAQ